MCKNKYAKIFEYLLHYNLRNVFLHIYLNSHFNQINKNICHRINRCKNKETNDCYTKIFCAKISDTKIVLAKINPEKFLLIFATLLFASKFFALQLFVSQIFVDLFLIAKKQHTPK